MTKKYTRWSTNNPEKALEYQRKWRNNNKDKLAAQNKRYRIKNQQKIYKYNKKRTQELRLLCYNHYSNNNIECVCCGEKHLEFLSIDHINNDGKQQRKLHPSHGQRFYSWLIKNDFPMGFQIMCMNCNFAKGKDSEHLCPHQKELIINNE